MYLQVHNSCYQFVVCAKKSHCHCKKSLVELCTALQNVTNDRPSYLLRVSQIQVNSSWGYRESNFAVCRSLVAIENFLNQNVEFLLHLAVLKHFESMNL